MNGPVHAGRRNGILERIVVCQWVAVGPRSIEPFLRHLSILGDGRWIPWSLFLATLRSVLLVVFVVDRLGLVRFHCCWFCCHGGISVLRLCCVGCHGVGDRDRDTHTQGETHRGRECAVGRVRSRCSCCHRHRHCCINPIWMVTRENKKA